MYNVLCKIWSYVGWHYSLGIYGPEQPPVSEATGYLVLLAALDQFE